MTEKLNKETEAINHNNGDVKPLAFVSPLGEMMADERSEAIQQLIAAIQAAAKPGLLVPLSDTARRHTYKPYQGVEAPAASLARFAGADPRLVTAGVNPKEMLDRVELVDHLSRAKALLTTVVRSIEDTMIVVREELFRDTSVIYRLAQANTRLSPELAETVEVFEDFLARGKKGKPAGEVTPAPVEEPLPTPRPLIPAVTGDS